MSVPGVLVRLEVGHLPAGLADLGPGQWRVGHARRELLPREAVLGVRFPVDVKGQLHERAKALFARLQSLLGVRALTQVPGEDQRKAVRATPDRHHSHMDREHRTVFAPVRCSERHRLFERKPRRESARKCFLPARIEFARRPADELLPSAPQVLAGLLVQVNNPSCPVEDHDCLCRPFEKGLAKCFPALFRQALELHDALSVRCTKGWYRIGAWSATPLAGHTALGLAPAARRPAASTRAAGYAAFSGSFPVHAGERQLTAPHRSCVEVVVADALAHRIQVDPAMRVAGECERPAGPKQRPEQQGAGARICVRRCVAGRRNDRGSWRCLLVD